MHLPARVAVLGSSCHSLDGSTESGIATAFARFALEPKEGLALAEEIVPFYSGKGDFVGSTDLATVNWIVPTT